jgi:hypothetical protein
MIMKKETLTLKSRINKPVLLTSPATIVVAGKATKNGKNCAPVVDRLSELVQTRRQVFIQMRHGAGYCGIPVELEEGWLTMSDVAIQGTKHQATAQRILIQINDGSYIAHLHAVDQAHEQLVATGDADE